MPFKKGDKNINRKGRPRKGESFADALLREAEEVLKSGISKREALSKVIYKRAFDGDLKALEMIMDRIDGKPRQSVELSGDPEKPVNLSVEFRKPQD